MTTYFEIYQRFKKGWEYCTPEYGQKKAVLVKYNIDYSNFLRAIKEPSERRLKIDWVASICVELGISTEWVMTGRGKMLQ